MSNAPASTAVLLLAYGGPDSLDDIPAYLLDIRGGRETPQHLIDEITERYRQIGGRSPLLEITQSAARKLGERIGLPVHVGMRHWHPYIKAVMAQMASDGIRHVVAICMAPHYSRLSIGAYRKKVDEAVAGLEATPMTVSFIEQWGTQPDYLEGIAHNVCETLARFPDIRRQAKIIFSAHSLPESIIADGDPYDTQLRETANLLAVKLSLPADCWTFCYQSAAQTGTPWLGPQVEAMIPALAAEGERNLIVAPIGFIADHVEVLYDLDIAAQKIAAQSGVRLERTPMLNDSEPLIAALASLVQQHVQLTA